MNNTTIDYLRHGEPAGGGMYRGYTIDDPLSEKGWSQMFEGIGSYSDWDVIISSPLKRCLDFAEELSGRLNIPVQRDPRFREIGFGVWEGKTRQQLKLERSDEFAAFYDNPVLNTPEGAEPVVDFYQRISIAHNEVLADNGGKNILLVAHAGVIRACLTHAIGAPVESMYNIKIINGRVSRVRYSDGRTNLELVNSKL